jgi:5-methylcytosine-specific restriction endonuclease McrA
MWYNIPVTQSGTGRFLMSSADGSIAYRYWVKHPVLLDLRPADCVTTSASSTGCFAMSRNWACVKCGGTERNKRGDCKQCAREYARQWRSKPENKDSQLRWGREGYARNPEKNLERGRRWRKENPDKALEISRRGYANNPLQRIANTIRWRRNHPEQYKQAEKARYQADPDKFRARSKAWRDSNLEKSRETDKQWRKNNPDKVVAKTHRRNARKLQNGGSYTAAEWRHLCKQYNNRCLACGRSDVKLTVDHVVPLHLGGSNSIENIQPLCGSCNSSKGTRAIDYRPFRK